MRYLLPLLILVGCTPAVPPAPPAPTEVPTPAPVPTKQVVSDAVPGGAFLFYEDFEKGVDKWQLPATAEVGWRLLNAHTCSGEYSLLLGREAQQTFQGSAPDGYVVLKEPLDLAKARRPMIKYDLLGKALPEGSVLLKLEVREPGGGWQQLDETRVADHDYMLTFASDLTPWAGKQLELRFFGAVKGVDTPTKGLYLDEVAVIESR